MWSQDIIDVLKTLQKNSISFSKSHKYNYFYYKKLSDYFRLPTIVLSSFASVISVGLKSYISNQNHINLAVCILSLIVGIINSIELYLKIQWQNLKQNRKVKLACLRMQCYFRNSSLE